MEITIDTPFTPEEIQNELKEAIKDFRRKGLLPIEEVEDDE